MGQESPELHDEGEAWLDALEPLAEKLAGGTGVDWDAADSSELTASHKAVLRQLRAVALIASAHERFAREAEDLLDPVAVPVAQGELRTWGKLILRSYLGRGSFGDVYRAWDPRLDREVALKLLTPSVTAETARSSTVISEGRALARVRHPNVVTVYGADQIGGRIGVWMEFVEGRTLAQRVDADGPLAPAETAAIGADLARALAAVHKAGLLHRDVKAQNVMCEPGGRIVLTDFGTAAPREGGESVANGAGSEGTPRVDTPPSAIAPGRAALAGTPLYLAPEVLDGAAQTARSDIYALGVLLFHALTGTFPVTGRTLREVHDRHREGQRKSLPEVRPDLPQALVSIVDRALDPDGAARFQTADEMAASLGEVARARVLKLLHAPVPLSEPRDSTVIEEGHLLARVHHPNVVTVHGADRIDGRAGVCMDFIRGRTLEQVLRDHGPLSPQEATLIGLDLCRALAAVHQAGLVHGDVKSQNVMREDGGRVVLMDFGAEREGADVALDHELTPLAETPIYLAPELFQGSRASIRSDLYSLGVVLYHLVTHAYPIAARTRAEIEEAHRHRHVRRLRDVRPDLPASFVHVIERALSPDPEARYASAGAMEAALAATMDTTGSQERRRPPSRKPWPRRMGWVAAASLLTVVSSAVALLIVRRPVQALPFAERDQVLVGAFDNHTGEPQMEGIVEAALEYELVNSRFLTVVPRHRIDDVLTLMRKPVETRLDLRVAREVAQRDGAIRAVVSGRLDRLGQGYVLTANVLAPADGAVTASVREQAATSGGLQDALRRLSNAVREAVGEGRADIRASGVQLEKVMTPSLQALKWYSQSYALGYRDNWPAALEFARRAVEADPDFASAQIWLAWCLHRNPAATATVDREREVVAARAVELARNATDWERYWIEGSQLIMFNRPSLRDEAVAKYKALLEIVPTHFWGLNNLITGLRPSGRVPEAVPYAVAAATLQPNDLKLSVRVFSLFLEIGDLERAQAYAERVRVLAATEGAPVPVDVQLFPAVSASWRGDIPSTIRALDALETSLPDLAGAPHDVMAATIIDWRLGLGRPRAAAELIATVGDTNEREFLQANSAFFADNLTALRQHIARVQIRDQRSVRAAAVNPRVPALSVIFLLVKAGFLERAEAELAMMQRLYVTPADRARFDLLRACISLERGDSDRAIALVTSATAGGRLFRPDDRMVMADACEAEARFRRGEVVEAVNALQHWQAAPFLPNPGPLRTRNQLRLAELYHAASRDQSARQLTDIVANVLSRAEPDFPLLDRLQRLQQTLGSGQRPAVAP